MLEMSTASIIIISSSIIMIITIIIINIIIITIINTVIILLITIQYSVAFGALVDYVLIFAQNSRVEASAPLRVCLVMEVGNSWCILFQHVLCYLYVYMCMYVRTYVHM